MPTDTMLSLWCSGFVEISRGISWARQCGGLRYSGHLFGVLFRESYCLGEYVRVPCFPTPPCLETLVMQHHGHQNQRAQCRVSGFRAEGLAMRALHPAIQYLLILVAMLAHACARLEARSTSEIELLHLRPARMQSALTKGVTR